MFKNNLSEQEITELAKLHRAFINTFNFDVGEDVSGLEKSIKNNNKSIAGEGEDIDKLRNPKTNAHRHEQEELFADALRMMVISPELAKRIAPNLFERLSKYGLGDNEHQSISEAYHKAKADGSNPELVKAVEDLLGKPKETTPTPQTGKGESIEAKKADIERRRQEELKPYDERDRKSIEQIDPSNKTPIVKVGDKFDQGLRVIIENTKTDDNYSNEKADNDGDGVEVITKIISPAEVDGNGRMTKAAKVEVTIFNNMQEADEAINKKLEKIKSLVGKKQKEINAKYDAELAALEKQTPSGIKETTPNVEGDWSKDVESTAKALEGVDTKYLKTGRKHVS